MPTKPFVGYFVVKAPEKGMLPSFAFGDEDHVRKVARRWNRNTSSQKSASKDHFAKNPSTNSDFTHQSALTSALSASVDFGMSQRQLIESASIAPILMELGMANGEIIKPTVDKAEHIETIGKSKIYGLNELQFAHLLESERRFTAAINGMKLFPRAIFLSLVATFDTLIVDILANMLKLQTDWLEKSDRVVSISRISQASDVNELIE